MRFYNLFIFFFCVFTNISAAADIVLLKPIESTYDHFNIEILEDTQSTFDIDDVLINKNWYTSNNNLSLGYSSSTFWLKFTIKNSTNSHFEGRLLFTESFLKNVDFYQQVAGKWQLTPNGAHVPIAERALKHHFPAFSVKLLANSSNTFLMKIKSDYGVFGSIQLVDQEQFYQKSLFKDSVHIFMIGAILIIAFYNLLLWLNLKDIIYFYYVGYALCYLGWLIIYSGHVLYITSPENFNTFNIALPLAFLFLILFSQRLLQTKKHLPKTHITLSLMAVGFFISALCIPFTPSVSFQLQNALAVILLPYLMFTGIRSIKYKLNNAIVYSIALFTYFIGLTTLGLMALGILPYNEIIRYAPFPGSLLEITLFSFALANRITQHKQETINAKTDLLLLEQNVNKILEQTINEKTQELTKQKEQLEHLSITDSLTNIYNRRGFRFYFDEYTKNSTQDKGFSLLMLDIDYFKNYNDMYGHQSGDKVLVAIARVLSEQAKLLNGYAFRLGGEEFALLFSSDDRESAFKAAQACHLAISKLAIEHKASHLNYITVSLGLVTSYQQDNLSIDKMYKLADDALYRAKSYGRNKIELADIL